MARVVEIKERQTFFKGKNVLALRKGTVVRVEGSTDPAEIGIILMKTDNSMLPFIELNTGILWGPENFDYVFELIKHPIQLTNED